MDHRKPLKGVEWTHNYQGKQDFDADLLRVRTRYYPRGGEGFVLRNGEWEKNDARPSIPPDARCSLCFMDEDILPDDVVITGETEQEVKAKVELWANEVTKKAYAALRSAFATQESA